MKIDWSTLTNDEIRDVMDDGREEIDRRVRLLSEALNGRPKGPGRPKNGALKLTAADLEPADGDS